MWVGGGWGTKTFRAGIFGGFKHLHQVPLVTSSALCLGAAACLQFFL